MRLEAYLDGQEPDVATLKKCIRKGTVGAKFVPVLCGSAFKNKGVQPCSMRLLISCHLHWILVLLKVNRVDGDEEIIRNPLTMSHSVVWLSKL